MTTNNIALLASLDETQKTTTEDKNGHRLHLTEARGRGARPTTPTPNDSLGEIGEGQNVAEQDPETEAQGGEQIRQRTPLETNVTAMENIQEAGTQPPNQHQRQSPTSTNEHEANQSHEHNQEGHTSNTERTKKKNKRHRNHKNKKNRASIKIASLNINGRGTLEDGSEDNKWFHLNQIMREDKISVLAIQEAHLTEEFVASINHLFDRRLLVLWSQGTRENSAGIAFVINKETTNAEKAKLTEIIPGRAAMLTIPWNEDKTLKIMNIYAPNDQSTNCAFWTEIQDKLETTNTPKPNIILGDFNTVEDSIDRLPNRADAAGQTKALQDLRMGLNLIDGWRTTNPTEKAYTHTAKGHNTQARLDRIYAPKSIHDTANDWKIETPAIKTDHKMVSVRITNPKSPEIGKGRWSMPQNLLKNETFTISALELGLELQNQIKNLTERSPENNPQKMFALYKKKLTDSARKIAKQTTPAINKELKSLEKDIKTNLNNNKKGEEDTLTEVGILQTKLEGLTSFKHAASRLTVKANDALYGETISNQWTAGFKEKKPRDIIYSLRDNDKENQPYVIESRKMSEIARNYHHKLLQNGIKEDEDEQERSNKIDNALSLITENQKLPERDKEKLAKKLTYENVEEAMRRSDNNKSTGINGIPYEFWKKQNARHIEQTKEGPNEGSFDVTQALLCVYNDIEAHGVLEGTNFAAGWMCPLYKKKDKREIENYRPITLLNTDYKMFTKALATKMCKIIHKIVHKSQAGFIPGRSIADQIKLETTMLSYCEANEDNGMIIHLDQEKAYDKVRHDYLWKTMRAYNLPESMIQTAKSLYESAKTQVVINGIMSSPFEVSRGVRQGDPWSCLLFDVGIEPLSNALRSSPKLAGFKIPGVLENIKTTLFADDTTTYLNEYDSYEDLDEILGDWCDISGARFNMGKTEIIPVGSKTYRKFMIEQRTNHRENKAIPAEAHIAIEGEPVRSLGAWVGNLTNDVLVWSKIIEKIKTALTRWGRGHPTLKGKKHIAQMMIAGMTQYSANVQGTPDEVEKELTQILRNFIWNNKKASISLQILQLPVEKGGLNLIDLEARNNAIELMWAKKYLALGPERPDWAYVADTLIQKNIPKSGRTIDKRLTINQNPFTQAWAPAMHSSSKLPNDLKKMLKTAKKYNVNIEAIRISEKAKKALPIWYHIGTEKHPAGFFQRRTTECMIEAHDIRNVDELTKTTRRSRDIFMRPRHKERRDCTCRYCEEDRLKGCDNPSACCKEANKMLNELKPKWHPLNRPPIDNLTLTRTRKEENVRARDELDFITYNPTIKKDDDLSHIIRVFTNTEISCSDPAYRANRENIPLDPARTVYTDGSCFDVGFTGAKTGSGIWFGENDPLNQAIKIPGLEQTNNVGEIVGFLRTVQIVSKFTPLDLVTDSLYVMNGLTIHLQSWEERGWIGIKNKKYWKALIAILRARGARTRIKWVKGHSDDEGNEAADKLANEGANKEEYDEIDVTIDRKFDLSGAQLSTLTQAIAYAGIKEAEPEPRERRGTTVRLDMTRHAVQGLTGKSPTDELIWKSLQNKDLSRKIRDFFWKTMHMAEKTGEFWFKIQNCEQNAWCQVQDCDELDSMDHILTSCLAPEANIIWALAEKLWRQKMNFWPKIMNAGSVLACIQADFKTKEGKKQAGENRLYRILISESAYLIWKLRCKRMFDPPKNGEQMSEREIHNKWVKTINLRLELDMTLTNPKYEKKATPRSKVIKTWRGVIKNEKDLLDDWTRSKGVVINIANIERPEKDRNNRHHAMTS